MIRTQQSQRPRDARAGMILLVVTIVLVMLSLAGFGFVAVMYTENKAAHLNVDERHVKNATESATVLLASIAAMDAQGRRESGGLYDNPDLFQGALLYAEPGTDAAVRMTVLAPRIDEGAYAGVRFGAENESTKLNLAVLPFWDRLVPESGRKALMQIPQMTPSVADAILDWLDQDRQQRSAGAESDYYSGLDPPYAPRNGRPESLDELLLVKGVTRELLFGADAKQNYNQNEEESESAPGGFGFASAGEELPWAAYLTLYSGERNVDSQGQPRAFLNTPDLRTLHQQIGGRLPDAWVRFIIAYRQFGPYTGSDEGQANATIRLDLTKPAKHKIASVLDLIGSRVAVPSDSGSAQVFQSPLRESPDSMQSALPRLMDAVTVNRSPVLHGRININLAPREIIAAVPNMPATVVDQILTSRGLPGSSDDSQRQHPAWPLAQGLLSLETMKQILPYVTCGGDVYRAQVVGFFDHGTPSARAEVVIDATAGSPRRVYYKDLRLLGRGYSLDVLRVPSIDNLADTSTVDAAEAN